MTPSAFRRIVVTPDVLRPFVAALALGTATLAAAAAEPTIYRCGNSYAAQPCTAAHVIDAHDARTPEQRVAAQRLAADERRQTTALVEERLARERARPRSQAGRLDRPAATPTPTLALEPAPKKRRAIARGGTSEDFVAFDPSTRAKKRGS